MGSGISCSSTGCHCLSSCTYSPLTSSTEHLSHFYYLIPLTKVQIHNLDQVDTKSESKQKITQVLHSSFICLICKVCGVQCPVPFAPQIVISAPIFIPYTFNYNNNRCHTSTTISTVAIIATTLLGWDWS